MPCIEDLENGLCINRTLEETKAYLETADFRIYSNSVRLDTTKYNDEKFIRESAFVNVMFSSSEPSWINSYMHVNEIEDETDYF